MLKYLRLTRAQTVPLEAVPAIVSATIATGSILTPSVWIWGLYGVVYHLAGYGANSLIDWEKGHDKDDPHKQHHPLNTGEISARDGRTVVLFLIFIGIVIATVMINSLLGVIVFFVGVLSGFAYNLYGKQTVFKFVFISIAHSTVFLLPYISLTSSPLDDFIFILGGVYMFLWVMFQIAVSGEIKDIKQDEENLMRRLGHFNLNSWMDKLFALSLTIIKIIPALIIVSIIGLWWPFYGLLLGLIGANVYLTYNLVWYTKPFDRKQKIRTMSWIEGISVAILCLMYASVEVLLVILPVASFVYVILMNRSLWGTWVAPDV